MLVRVALHGFAEADRRALSCMLRDNTCNRNLGYRIALGLSDADLILADSGSAHAIASVVESGRLASTVFLGERAHALNACHVDRPTTPERLLLALDTLAAKLHVGRPAVAPAPSRDRNADARAAVRRARLAATAEESGPLPFVPDVLVLDPQDADREHLCKLLEHFGFCAYPARGNDQARWLLQSRPFRAVFLDTSLDGDSANGGFELCQLAKTKPLTMGAPAAALFIVSGTARPADRVLAALAGSDAFLAKPLSRGDVAGSLEAFGVAMPADDRRR
jgi:CheY-like chemotaxis protein